MKILIYGSTYITQVVVKELKQFFDLVGYIPSFKPIFGGNVDLEVVDEKVEHDIALSIQYDRMIANVDKGFNLHTGLLPEYGGCDILLHTLINGESHQGLSFHKMTDRFDFGPIILKTVYPVFRNDTILDLYKRVCSIAPVFAKNALLLLEHIGLENVNNCQSQKPKIYKRNVFDDYYRMMYEDSYKKIKQWTEQQS